MSGDDDSGGGPGFLDPTRRHSLPGMWTVPSLSHLTKEGMIRLTADQLYYQHRVPLWPLGEFSLTYFKIDGLWPNTTATGLLARDREYFWIRLQPSFRVACQRGGAYGWKRCVVEWSIKAVLWPTLDLRHITKWYTISCYGNDRRWCHLSYPDGRQSC